MPQAQICRFYLRGNCKFGDRCRFLHQDNDSSHYGSPNQYQNSGHYGGQGQYGNSGHFSNSGRYSGPGYYGNSGQYSKSNYNDRYHYESPNFTKRQPQYQPAPVQGGQQTTLRDVMSFIHEEISQWGKDKQWPFSCYSPRHGGSCYPGYVDVSPEELRYIAYNHEQNNSSNKYLDTIDKLMLHFTNRQREVLNPSGNEMEFLKLQYQNIEIPSALVEPLAAQITGLLHYSSPSPAPPPSTMNSFRFELPSQPLQSPANQTFGAVWPTVSGSSLAGIANSVADLSDFGSHIAEDMEAAAETPKPVTVAAPTKPPATKTEGSCYLRALLPDLIVPSLDELLAIGCYTPMNELSDVEMKQFRATQFTLNEIPDRPPPRELC